MSSKFLITKMKMVQMAYYSSGWCCSGFRFLHNSGESQVPSSSPSSSFFFFLVETKNILLNIYTLLLKGVPRTLYSHLTGFSATCAFLGNKRASASQVNENGTLMEVLG